MRNQKLSQFSELQKVMLINAHPVKNIFNLISLPFIFYFLWIHDPIMALTTGLGIALLGTILATAFWKMDVVKISTTFFGKLYMCFATKIGFGLYITSHILIPLGFWLNNLSVALVGLMLMIIAILIYKRVLN
jgi:hypothetical protein